MATTLDTCYIRRCTPDELRYHYKTLPHQDHAYTITHELLQAIERGSIAPDTFAPWLGVLKSTFVIDLALRQCFSVIIRKHAIEHLGKSLRSWRWKQIWDGLGGTAGLLEIFRDLSVHEVRQACKALGQCGKGKDVSEKRRHITDLFMGLQPHLFPDAPFRTTDKRPLTKYYRHLLPSCEEEIVDRTLSWDPDGGWKPVKDEYLMRYHPRLMRREQLRVLEGDTISTINEQRLAGLMNQYPKDHGTIPGFSASMDYCLLVLQNLVEADTSKLEDHFFINNLARPLLRRVVKKKIKWEKIQEIVDMIMKYLQKYPSAGKEFDITEGDVMHLVGNCWAQKPDFFEQQLRTLCSHPIFGTSKYDKLTDWDDFLVGIPRPRRYALVRLCFQESTGLNIDNLDDLKKVKGGLSDDLLNKLNCQEALSLFTRLQTAKGDEGLVTIYRGNTILNIAPAFEGSGADPHLYEVVLQSQAGHHEEAHKLAWPRIEFKKRLATSASKPEERAFYAKSALYYAVASGSPYLYQETVKWTERFLRDPLVLRELYPRGNAREVIRLLSGVPEGLGDGHDIFDVSVRISLCNTILASMFDTACAALRESSFSASDWVGTFDLLQSVVKERIEQSKKLRKVLGASNEKIYEISWKHTIEMLIAVEEKANQTEFQRLLADAIRGPLDCVLESHINLDTEERSTYRFLDNLARARDTLWEKLRPTVYPAVLALPKAFPRGLPIQHLTAPWTLNVQNLEELAPYIASRVQVVVFPDSSESLQPIPEDKESTAAIGTFVDSYHYALQLYIPKSCEKNERAQRVQKAWSHAIGPLSRVRMSEEEATRFWRDVHPRAFQGWPPASNTQMRRKAWPLIPETEDAAEPHEWNPFTCGRPDIESRDLGPMTYLDLSLMVLENTPHSPKLRSCLHSCAKPEVPADSVSRDVIWHQTRYMGEGGILSALLYLEMKFGASCGRLLETPFPSKDDVRYPSLYLDDEFQGDELNHFTAVRCISGHLDLIPPTLLRLSARNMLGALAASDQDERATDHTTQELALTLIIRLASSDRPVLAQESALKTVLDRQSASSWHRQLLKPTYFRRLSAKDAQTCFDAFANAVLERISRKDEREKANENERVNTRANIAQSSQVPFVKVTTVKILAQLLQGTEFVGEDTAFSVLSRLLGRATHVDVRVNAVKGLLAMLETGSDEVTENIFVALEGIVPETGGLIGGELPSKSDEGDLDETRTPLDKASIIDDSSPLITALSDHYRHGSINGERMKKFIARILLPALEYHIHQTSDWATIFLRNYEIDNSGFVIPPEPRDASIILSLLEADGDRSCYIPHALLEKYMTYSTFKIAPPAPIMELNKKLRNDHTLQSQPDVRTWLLRYDQGIDLFGQTSTFDILSLLDTPTKLSDNIGITPHIIQTLFLKLFTTILWANAPTYNHLNSFLANLLNGTHLVKPWWPIQGRPIVEAMIAYVDSIRTCDWERDPERTPAVLPNTFPWRCLLLDYAWSCTTNTPVEADHKGRVFASQLTALIDNISGGVYHIKLAYLKSYLALDPVSSTADRSIEKKVGHWTIYTEKRDRLHDLLIRNRIITAVYLGDISRTRLSWVTQPEFLRIEVTSYILGLVGQEDWEGVVNKDLMRRVLEMIKQWKGCEHEEVRRVGCEVEKNLSLDM